MLITIVGEYQAAIKTHDQREDYWRESVVSIVSLWWKGADVEEGCGVLVSEGIAGGWQVASGDGWGQKVSEVTQTGSKNNGVAIKSVLVELVQKGHVFDSIGR